MTPVLERLFALETFGIKLGLTNIESLCEALDHPERAFRSVHVAGTNGKGSVTAMVHAGLRAGGLRSARYTSPHLVHLNERFVIGDGAVADAPLAHAAARVLDVAARLVETGTLPAPPTFFEVTTAMAFELFREAGVELAVIEVGLGGRFDATNVLTPDVAAITTIGLDHQPQLGTSLASIAFEKAGIIKHGVPVVIGPLADQADAVVAQVAADRGAPVFRTRQDVQAHVRMSDGPTVVDIESPAHRYDAVALALRGAHQVDNAIVALRVMEILRDAGVNLPFDAIARGLGTAAWPGRLETIELPGRRAVLLDAAHNPDGAGALSQYLAHWHRDRPALVFGAMQDKDVEAMLRVLLPAVGPVVVTAPAMRRALAPSALAEIVRAIDPRRVVIVEADPAAAVDRALEHHSAVCVAGSIFLVGAVRDALQARAMLR